MILLDTNVISELMKPQPNQNVIRWIDRNNCLRLFVSTVTIAEISYGLHALPQGQRRNLLEHAFNKTIQLAFQHRILAFDEAAAHSYGKIMAERKAKGRPFGVPDGQIAAIAHSKGFSLATRNERDFMACGLEIINPWIINLS